MAATNLLGNIINTHPFEDRKGSICRFFFFGPCFDADEMLSISSHFRLFSWTWQKALHNGSKDVDRKPSMLYTMIVKSLVDCWDNFEQNTRMLARF